MCLHTNDEKLANFDQFSPLPSWFLMESMVNCFDRSGYCCISLDEETTVEDRVSIRETISQWDRCVNMADCPSRHLC